MFSQARLLLLFGAGVVACSSAEETEEAWSCSTADVPMGEVVRCTQGALTMDGPAAGEAPSSSLPNGESYECTAGEPECPPIDTTGGAGGTSDGPPESDEGSRGPGNGGGNGNGNGNGPKNGDFGSAGPRECSYVPDLPYCGGEPSDDSSGGTTDGTRDRGKGGEPGQQREGGAGRGKGKRYKCVKDEDGNKSCESTPDCAVGSRPSACGACVPDGEPDDCVPPSAGGCWVTGGGFIVGPNTVTGAEADGHDNFGGNAKPMKNGRIQGHWNHIDHGTGNHAKGKPAYIVCRRVDEPGPGQPGGKKGFSMNQVYFGGPAEWRSNDTWASGYWFDVVAKDHGEPGSVPHAKNGGMPDTYHFTIRLMDDPENQVSGALVYETMGELEGGNIQMHAPNGGHPYAPSELPSWVAYEP